MEKRCFHCLGWANKRFGSSGLTLIELMLVVAIVGGLTGLAIPAYSKHRDKVLAQQAAADILNIELSLDKYYAENGRYPDSLADIGKAGLQDPWGNSYRFLNMANDPHQNLCRKIRNIHPINSDYDLYSIGKDAMTTKSINADVSWDDIIRAYDGSFVGRAQDII
ncbi:MAG TPA: type II secretion system protein GspG [Deltaproteobacteria bacterium]|nr:type II secretion system protein GspG [Deltaproteobacteria bacterium]HPJ94672.1 type II secretion system protein GspG [Deltaproteobacteria bacterium]HPR52071.1 type II secretion system protein GspG [Deltaproteobacteria bacterium]